MPPTARSDRPAEPSDDPDQAEGTGPAGDAPHHATETASPGRRPDRSTGPGCKECGAAMTWDPEADALRCAYCGATRAVPAGEAAPLEHPLESAGEAARGFGLELRVSECAECGARVTFEGSDTAVTCAFCGSARVLEQSARRNAIAPGSLIPLDLGRQAVEQAFAAWLKRLWFRPRDLSGVRATDAQGLYVPYWTFDASVASEWTAMSGTYYWVTQPVTSVTNGKPVVRMQRVRKVRWRPAAGERADAYDDLLVPAGKGLSTELLERLGGFDTTALVSYAPEYLAGWRAEEYQLDLEQGWERGRESMLEQQRARCAGDVPGDTERDLRVHSVFSEVRFKHVLLPVWSLVFRYGGKAYPVLVNGQTGRVAGRAPLSWVKILLALAGVGLALIAFGALS